jgi:Skp family chaperone for outer membrane proteins
LRKEQSGNGYHSDQPSPKPGKTASLQKKISEYEELLKKQRDESEARIAESVALAGQELVSEQFF